MKFMPLFTGFYTTIPGGLFGMSSMNRKISDLKLIDAEVAW